MCKVYLAVECNQHDHDRTVVIYFHCWHRVDKDQRS